MYTFLGQHGMNPTKLLSAWDLLNPLEGNHKYELYHISSHRWSTPEYHVHDFYEFYFFISGDAEALIEEFSTPLRPGDIVVFPPGFMHRAHHHNPHTYYERMLIYLPRNVLRAMGSPEYSLLDVLDACVARSQFLFSLGKKKFEHCCYNINEIINDEVEYKQPSQSLINYYRVSLLATQLCHWFEEASKKDLTGPASAHSVDSIGNIIAYINEHLTEDLSLECLSNKFFISKYYLMHEFKARTNMSVHQFIMQKRVNLARMMLQFGINPSEAAARCGFGDYSCFYRAFRKENGLSPNQYLSAVRKQLQEQPV